jgi:hypothetical protein
VPDIPTRIEFLKKLHLFRGLNDDELAWVADELQEKTFQQAGTVFEEGSDADSLYIVFDGRVNISRRVKDKVVKIASLVRGDYFGEQGLVKDKKRTATVDAEPNTILLILFRDPFNRLLSKSVGLHQNFDIMMDSRKLANELQFKWLAENEIIYFLTRKHTFLLVRAMILPVFLIFPILAIIWLAFQVPLPGLSLTIAGVGGFLFVADIAWGAWRWVDWGNDYYIVTNQRVIWLEKVVGLYDSRTEAGVSTILSVSTETDYWGRVWDYGTVVVRTFTGQIRLNFVRHPRQAAAMIEEYWNRAKEGSRRAGQDVMRKAIRLSMGIDKPPPPPPVPEKPPKPPKKPSAFAVWKKNAFRMRIEDGNTVTYHKHIFVMIRNTTPFTISILLLALLMLTWPLWFNFDLPTWMAMLILTGMFILFCFAVYRYLDWENDMYQVTPDQIVDVNRKPFGTEDRKAAPLENILSTEYKRTGILGMLLNYGTVIIMVGGAQFRFEDVADPPGVQQDIVRRQAGRLAKKREVDGAADRDRMAEWLAVYHRPPTATVWLNGWRCITERSRK